MAAVPWTVNKVVYISAECCQLVIASTGTGLYTERTSNVFHYTDKVTRHRKVSRNSCNDTFPTASREELRRERKSEARKKGKRAERPYAGPSSICLSGVLLLDDWQWWGVMLPRTKGSAESTSSVFIGTFTSEQFMFVSDLTHRIQTLQRNVSKATVPFSI